MRSPEKAKGSACKAIRRAQDPYGMTPGDSGACQQADIMKGGSGRHRRQRRTWPCWASSPRPDSTFLLRPRQGPAPLHPTSHLVGVTMVPQRVRLLLGSSSGSARQGEGRAREASPRGEGATTRPDLAVQASSSSRASSGVPTSDCGGCAPAIPTGGARTR